jgi:hypothetical protein
MEQKTKTYFHERSIKMEKVIGEVKTKTAGPWTLEMYLPDSVAEFIEVYGDEGTLYLARAGLKVKQQNIGRDVLANGGTPEEANQKARDYRPGGPGKVSNMTKAFDLIQDKALELAGNPTLAKEVRDLLQNKKFKEVIEKLGEKAEPENIEED